MILLLLEADLSLILYEVDLLLLTSKQVYDRPYCLLSFYSRDVVP